MSDANVYTIGWICAIKSELVAAKALLDELHDPPESVAQHDNNSYSLGRMGRHNVVIAALPKSEYGTTAAATVARDMLSSFPNVRIGLMVGVGGGAPSKKHDIRLGDIVVGTRNLEAGKGGVIQYDYGKTMQDRAFILTGSLNQAPQVLLTAVSNLEAQYALDGHRLNQHIEKALERFPRLRKTHGRPSSDSDRLYLPHIVHPSIECQSSCIESCGDEPFHLVTRRQRDEGEDNPAIHYGLIASSNQLMKDARNRDTLAGEMGVLCFEMEAAGLMNHFPCLVVRGICDYSDTHKTKEWQGFAAMAAAAYAKNLLSQIVPSKVESERRLAAAIDLLLEGNISQEHSIKETKSAVLEWKRSEQVSKVQKWLSPPDASSIPNHSRGIRQEGTGAWIFSDPIMQEWLLGSRQHIWLHGLPGCGKTVLATRILDHLETTLGQITLQFFFDFQDDRKQTLNAMIRSLIFQVYVLGGSAAAELDGFFEDHQNGWMEPSTTSLVNCFKQMIRNFAKVVILLDALDESGSRKELLEWITACAVDPDLMNVKIILISRPEEEFLHVLESCPGIGKESCRPLSKSLIDSDISIHVRARLATNLGFQRWSSLPWVLNKITHEILAKSNGMFRWAGCQLDSLETCLDTEMVEAALANIPLTLNETYDRIWNLVLPHRKAKTVCLLQFLVHSKRPLTLQQAAEILAVRHDGFNPVNIMPCPREVLQLCPGFLTVQAVGTPSLYKSDEEAKKEELHLAHFSVKEYLLDCQSGFERLEANTSITDVCLTYLASIAKSGFTDSFSSFAHYAGRFCFSHAQVAMACNESAHRTADFLQDEHNVGLLRQLLKETFWRFHRSRGFSGPVFDAVMKRGGALEFACFFDLEKIAEILLNRGISVHGAIPEKESALFVAVGEHNVQMTLLLLSRGAAIDFPGILHQAAMRPGLNVMSLLLERGADVNSSFEGSSVLYEATKRRELKRMKLLVTKGANVNAINEGTPFSTALILAVHECFKAGVELLLAHGADPNKRDPAERPAYEIALKADAIDIASMLLKKGADPDVRGCRMRVYNEEYGTIFARKQFWIRCRKTGLVVEDLVLAYQAMDMHRDETTEKWACVHLNPQKEHRVIPGSKLRHVVNTHAM